MTGKTSNGYLLPAEDRQTLLTGPLGAHLVLDGSTTERGVSVVEHPLAPRALGSPVHTHRDEDEYSIVLDGTVGVQVGGFTGNAGPGDLVIKPKRVPHAFWNPTDQPARLLEIIRPAGFERYFIELDDILNADGPLDTARLGALAERYHLDLDPASIPVLAQAHGLTALPGAH